jgi:hypothetical protein
MSITTYSPEKIDVIVNGVRIHGFAEGSLVSVESSSDTFTLVVGADGEPGRSHNPDKSGTITLTLKSDSDSNDYLSGLALADELSLVGTFPVLVKDGNGTSLTTTDTAWVQKQPTAEHAREMNEREWVLQAARLIRFTGGSF